MSASSYSGVVNRNAFLTRSTASTSANGAAQAIAGRNPENAPRPDIVRRGRLRLLLS